MPKPVAIYALIDAFRLIRYVGKTIMPKIRWRSHKVTRPWAVAMKILEWSDETLWPAREKYWIDKLRSNGHPLENKAAGGAGPNGWKMPSASIKKWVRTRKKNGWKIGDAQKLALLKANIGRPCSEATRAKIADAQICKKISQSTRGKLKLAWRRRKARGWKFSEDSLEKIRSALSKRVCSKETRIKLRINASGKKPSHQTRQKISMKVKRLWEAGAYKNRNSKKEEKVSHVVKIEVAVKDLTALEKAAKQLGLEFCANQTSYKWYGRYMEDSPLPEGFSANELGKCLHALRLPGNSSAYEIGVAKSKTSPGWVLLADFWQGGYGLEQKVGKNAEKLKQEYAVQVSMKKIPVGFRVTRTTQTDGRVILRAVR